MLTNNQSEASLLLMLKDYGVTLNDSVALLCKLKNIQLNKITQEAGYNRMALYKALQRNARPKERLLQSVIKYLEVDPWLVYEDFQAKK